MADSGGEGGSMDAFWVILIILVMFIMWVQGGGPSRAKNESLLKINSNSSFSAFPSGNSGGNGSQPTNTTNSSTESQYKGQVYIQTGTASATDQPNREYIVLYAGSNNPAPIKIGGWVLRNGRSERNFDVSGTMVQGQSVSVPIPSKGVIFFNPYQSTNNVQSPITLNPGDSATIVTGQVPTVAYGAIKDNFRVNRCLGYFVDKAGYSFPYNLYYNCPQPREIMAISELSDTCYNFAQSIPSCHEPKEYFDDNHGNCLEHNCNLDASCKAVLVRNLNFQTCFNEFSKDKDFVSPNWIIFLNRTWELWSNQRETIYLYDNLGKLVDKVSY